MKPRIYGDADVSPSLMPLLRADGYDAVSCLDLGWGEEPDEWHLLRATAEDRVVLTYNVRDFRRLAIEFSRDGRQHAGIIASYHQYRRDDVGLLHQLLRVFLATRTSDDFSNTFLVLPSPAGVPR